MVSGEVHQKDRIGEAEKHAEELGRKRTRHAQQEGIKN